jgi:predicted secreted protein
MLLTLSLFLFAASQAADAPASATTPKPAKEKLICERETPIGSLIATRKVCLTQSEWEKRRVDGNDAARRMMMDNMGRPSCTGGSC